MRMRTIDQIAEYLKKTDPETALTKTAIRRLVISDTLPHVKAGRKYLVSIEAVEDYLEHGETHHLQPAQGAIRRVEVRHGT
jgi:excisionase family DNA binding protein